MPSQQTIDLNRPFDYQPDYGPGTGTDNLLHEIRSLVREMREERFERRMERSTMEVRAAATPPQAAATSTFVEMAPAAMATAPEVMTAGAAGVAHAGIAASPVRQLLSQSANLTLQQLRMIAAQGLGLTMVAGTSLLGMNPMLMATYYRELGEPMAMPPGPEPSFMPFSVTGWQYPIAFAIGTGMTFNLVSRLFRAGNRLAEMPFRAWPFPELGIGPPEWLVREPRLPGIMGMLRRTIRPRVLLPLLVGGYIYETYRQGGFVPIFGSQIEADIGIITGNRALLLASTYGTPQEDIELAREDLITRVGMLGGVSLQTASSAAMGLADLAWVAGTMERFSLTRPIVRGIGAVAGRLPLLRALASTPIPRAFMATGRLLASSFAPWIAIQAVTESARLIGSEMIETSRYFNILSAYQAMLAFGGEPGPGGWGLPAETLREMAASMAELEVPGYTGEDIQQVLEAALQGGLLIGIRDPNEIRRRMRRLMNQVRVVQRVFRATLEDAVRFIQEFETLDLTGTEFLRTVHQARFAATSLGLPPYLGASLFEPSARLGYAFFPGGPAQGFNLLAGGGILAQVGFETIPGIRQLVRRVGPTQVGYQFATAAGRFFMQTPMGQMFLVAAQNEGGLIEGDFMASLQPWEAFGMVTRFGYWGAMDRYTRARIGLVKMHGAEEMPLAYIMEPIRVASMYTSDPAQRAVIAANLALSMGYDREAAQMVYAIARTDDPEAVFRGLQYETRRRELESRLDVVSPTMIDYMYGAGMGGLLRFFSRATGWISRHTRAVGRDLWMDLTSWVDRVGSRGFMIRRAEIAERQFDDLRAQVIASGGTIRESDALREFREMAFGLLDSLRDLGVSESALWDDPKLLGIAAGYTATGIFTGVIKPGGIVDTERLKAALTKRALSDDVARRFLVYTNYYAPHIAEILMRKEITEKDISDIMSIGELQYGQIYLQGLASVMYTTADEDKRKRIADNIRKINEAYSKRVAQRHAMMPPIEPSSPDIAPAPLGLRRPVMPAGEPGPFIRIVPLGGLTREGVKAVASARGIELPEVEESTLERVHQMIRAGIPAEVAIGGGELYVLDKLNRTLEDLLEFLRRQEGKGRGGGVDTTPVNPMHGGP